MVTMADIEKLAPDEKLELVTAIWDSFAANPEDVPISAEEVRLLDEREREMESGKVKGLSLEEFRARLAELRRS
jgi:putative addiction module component (TIGR02574 family)